jgi:hypothetical protein
MLILFTFHEIGSLLVNLFQDGTAACKKPPVYSGGFLHAAYRKDSAHSCTVKSAAAGNGEKSGASGGLGGESPSGGP